MIHVFLSILTIAGLFGTDAHAAAPIADGAVSAITKQSYPKTFAQWGAAGVEKINTLAPLAAAQAAKSPECDRVEIVELSGNRSTPGKSIVFFVDCANGKRFYISENDLKTTATAVSQSKKMETLGDADAIVRCETAIKTKLAIPSGFSRKIFSTSVYRAPTTGNTVVTFDFEAKNQFGGVLPYAARCVFTDRGLEDAEMSLR
jgi:hypothetical protein